MLGWQLFSQTVGDSMVADKMPAEKASILHSQLSNNEQTIMSSDLHWGETLQNGNGCQVCISCSTEDELYALFNHLSKGGTVIQSPIDLPWNSISGSLIDKYGKYWLLNFDKNNIS